VSTIYDVHTKAANTAPLENKHRHTLTKQEGEKHAVRLQNFWISFEPKGHVIPH